MINLWWESKIGADGKFYETFCAKLPKINEHDLYCGGEMYKFWFDYKKNTTELYKFHYLDGVPIGFDRCLKKWKDEILTTEECIDYLEERYENE